MNLREAISIWILFVGLVACAAPTIETGAIQTAASKTVIAQITASAPAPTSGASSSPVRGGDIVAPTPSPAQPPPPQGSPRFTPQFNPFVNLTQTQRECLSKELGDKAFQEISGFARPPSREEEPAMGKCLAFQTGVGQPPGGAQTPDASFGTPPPGVGQPPAGGAPAVFNDQTWTATSTDGLTWSEATLLAEKASVPEVMRTSKNVFWAYWVDFSNAPGPGTEKIGVAKSADGKTWEKLGNAKFTNLGNKVPVDPDIVELDDGRFRLYFYDIAVKQGDHPIHSAVSFDGINFAVEEGVRFKAENIFDPDVVHLKDGPWRMYINNADNIISATSADGLNFTADGGVRVPGMGSIPGSIVLGDGSVRLYKCEKGISSYKSVDGLNFVLEKESVIRRQGVLCDPSITSTAGGYLMVFKTNPGQ